MEHNPLNQQHFGSGDNIAGDKVTYIYNHSVDYQKLEAGANELKAQQEKLQEQIRMHPNIEFFGQELLKVSAKYNEVLAQIEAFKDNVFRLYELFTKIEINTERLKQAKAHFDKGEFREADAILKTEDLASDLSKIKIRESQLDKEKAELQTKREQIANEFLVKAQLWQTFYHEPDWEAQALSFYEQSLDAYRSPESLCFYGTFLQMQNRFKQALPLYEDAIKTYRTLAKEDPNKYLLSLATALNNLGALYRDLGQFKTALTNYQEALRIRRELAKEPSPTYLSDLAQSLNNLGSLQRSLGQFKDALNSLQQAIQIYETLAKSNPVQYLPLLADSLNNLGNLQSDSNKLNEALTNFERAIQINQMLVKENSSAYLSDLATTLHNLAVLQHTLDDDEAALINFEKAIEYYRELVKVNPSAHFPKLAGFLSSLGALKLGLKRPDEAMKALQEALLIFRKLIQENPEAHLPDLANALNNLGAVQTNLDLPDALANLQEGLDIRRKLVQENQEVYLPLLVSSLNNLGSFYMHQKNREQSIKYIQEALRLMMGSGKSPQDFAKHLQILFSVLRDNGLSDEAIKKIWNSIRNSV